MHSIPQKTGTHWKVPIFHELQAISYSIGVEWASSTKCKAICLFRFICLQQSQAPSRDQLSFTEPSRVICCAVFCFIWDFLVSRCHLYFSSRFLHRSWNTEVNQTSGQAHRNGGSGIRIDLVASKL